MVNGTLWLTTANDSKFWKDIQYSVDTIQINKTETTVPKIKQVIFNDPATIIIWDDNSKSVVKCQNDEPFDAEKGFVMAYLKKLLGNDNTFNKEIRKWVKQ